MIARNPQNGKMLCGSTKRESIIAAAKANAEVASLRKPITPVYKT